MVRAAKNLGGLSGAPRFDNSYARLPEAFYRRVLPAAVPKATLVRLNQQLSDELVLDPSWLRSADGVAMLSGNRLPAGADSIAMAYGGHQFGSWNPGLGDGRALLLGEVFDRNGIRRDVQLKGSGQTPFSRSGDGKATLGSVLREYIVSEAMFALGIPTTRSLAVVTTGESVHRETPLPGAVLTRVARSHVRVGTFQLFANRDPASVRALADYVIQRHFPEDAQAVNPYRALLESVMERQAQLVARWMQLGFIHGVMNTDNMQVAGETIDYGPCAFMDEFHPKCVFSSIDHYGRYAWNQQPVIAQWNLHRLAEALLPLLGPSQDRAVAEAAAALSRFQGLFQRDFVAGFRRKLGLLQPHIRDSDFIDDTLETLANQGVDFTLFFRRLTQIADGSDTDELVQLFVDPDAGRGWLARWQDRVALEDSAAPRAAVMRGVNPVYIPRNHRVEEAIRDARKGDFSTFEALVAVLARPYVEQPENAAYERAPTPAQKVHETFCGT
jgi:uncharacterized protein YdiU (UPF0061 family)